MGRAWRRRDPALIPAIGLLGGTFDPIHYGHLRMADEVRSALHLPEVRLIPAGNPYHRADRPPSASATHRLAMARLGVAEFEGLTVDAREAKSPEPSYTVDTLSRIRAEVGTLSLLLLLGADAFLTLPGWKRWTDLFDLAHLVLIARPGSRIPEALPPVLAASTRDRQTQDPTLLTAGTGRIYVQPVTPQPISATEIRSLVGAGVRPSGRLPETVIDYIESHRLYQKEPT